MTYDLQLQWSCLLTRGNLGLIMCREWCTFMGQITVYPLRVLKMCFCSNRSQFHCWSLKHWKNCPANNVYLHFKIAQKITKHRHQHIKEKRNNRYIFKKGRNLELWVSKKSNSCDQWAVCLYIFQHYTKHWVNLRLSQMAKVCWMKLVDNVVKIEN